MENSLKSSLTLKPMNGLKYDMDEVDTFLYMFSKECSGSVMLLFSDDITKYGRVYINGLLHEDYKIININTEKTPIICIKVRGVITEYDSKVPLKIEGFCDKNGNEMTPAEFEISVAPRRNDKPEKYKYNDSVAFKAAAESFVLLKNDGALPIKSGENINLFGQGVAEYRTCAVGAGRINPRTSNNLVDSLREFTSLKVNEELAEFYAKPSNKIPDEQILNNAKEKSETAVMVITRGTGENIDNRPIKGEFYLSSDEERLISRLTSEFNKVIVILNVGYSIDVRFLEKYNVNACLYTGFGGMYCGEATAAMLEGKYTPCGKLPDTWALDYYDIPAAHNFLNFAEDEAVLQTDDPFWSTVCYEEGVYVGYRYFTTFNKQCAFPFGYGLSYTEFSKNAIEASWNSKEFTAKIAVKNIGEVQGKEAVQIYASKPNKAIEQVKVELVDFEKTKLLNPDEEQILEFKIPARHFAAYNQKTSRWILAEGEYKLFIGENAENLSQFSAFTLDNEVLLQQVKSRAACELPFTEMSLKSGKSFPTDKLSCYHKEPFKMFERARLFTTELEKPQKKIMFSDVCEDLSLAEHFVAQLSDWELCRMSVCSINYWNMDTKGEAGFTYELPNFGLSEFSLADGNNGVNIKKRNIGMPSSCMVAATFDKQLAYEVGSVIASEAKESGIGILLGPGMNIHRNPLNGRNPEYFSEDPLLSGIMAGYQNKGFQDMGVSGCLKHFAGNNCEAVRKRSSSFMSERALREIYVKTFEYALEVTPSDTVMTGYNAVNGCFCDEDTELLEGILREELGFDGFVMSDWNSYDSSDMVKMVKAGVSFLTPGSFDETRVAPLAEALEKGLLTRAELERNVVRLITVLARRNNGGKNND